MNIWNGIGRLTKDVEMKALQNGNAVGTFTLAVNRPFKSNDGVEADFIRCVAFDTNNYKRATNLSNMTTKGSQLGVNGRIQTRSYQNDQGQTIYVTEVVVDNFTLVDTKETTDKLRAKNGGQNNWSQQQAFDNPFAQEAQQGQTNNQFGQQNQQQMNNPFAQQAQNQQVENWDAPF